jgi:hypothetical protein
MGGFFVPEQYNITLKEGFRGAKNRPVQKNKDSGDAWYYLGLVGQIGYVVALPLAGGAIIGSLVGNTLIGILVGFVISVFGFIRIIQRILQIKE